MAALAAPPEQARMLLSHLTISAGCLPFTAGVLGPRSAPALPGVAAPVVVAPGLLGQASRVRVVERGER
jgi:hypothetical protein